MNLDAKALVGFIKEIEDSRTRQKAETEFQRDVLKRAVKKHFDAKAIRIVLQRRAMDSTLRDEQDYNVECYELALAGKKAAIEALEQGATIREAAAAGGISTGAAGNLAKVVQESSFVNTDPAPETPARDGTGTSDQPDAPGSAVASLSEPPEPRVAAPNSIDNDPWERVGEMPDGLRRARA